MPTPSRSQQSILIDAVFYNCDKHLMEAFRDRLDQLERRQQLKHVSDISHYLSAGTGCGSCISELNNLL